MLNKEDKSSLTQSYLCLGMGGKWAGCLLIWKSKRTYLEKKADVKEADGDSSKINNF